MNEMKFIFSSKWNVSDTQMVRWECNEAIGHPLMWECGRGTNSATISSMALQLVAHLTSPSQLAIRAEMLVQVSQTLEDMDPIDREILALRHFEELRNSEVAEVLQLKEAAASNRYIRALTRLRTALAVFPGFFDDET